MKAARVALLLLLCSGLACAIDNLFVDELEVTISEPAAIGLVLTERTNEPGWGLWWCGAHQYDELLPHAELEPGTTVVTVETESSWERDSVLVRVWIDGDGDGVPAREELGVCEFVDLAEVDAVELPRPGASLTEDGAFHNCLGTHTPHEEPSDDDSAED